MWRKALEIFLVVLTWAAMAAYVVCSYLLVERHKENQKVERVDVVVKGGSMPGLLITPERVRDMLLEQNIATIGTKITQVDTDAIESMICSHGFVDDVDIYTSYSGTLHINISQRMPVMRLLTKGYDVYVTSDGFVFGSPTSAALYVPVVSGDYRPIFEPHFEGRMESVLESFRRQTDDSIAIIAKSAEPVKDRERRLKERRKEIRDSSVKKENIEAWKIERKRLLKNIEGHLRDCDRDFERIAARQRGVESRFEKRQRDYNDFCNFLSFIEHISADKFWRAEIVQIVAEKNSAGSISLNLIPRSGDYSILFGEVADSKAKLERLQRFYDDVAASTGWDSYKSVDVSIAGRIVCTKREKEI